MDLNCLAKIPKLLILILGLLLFSSLASGFGLFQLNQLTLKQSIPASTQYSPKLVRNQLLSANIIVDVQGAVEKPGVYELPNNSRLLAALKKAGGISPEADRYLIAKNFNLAKKLIDEEKVYLPFLEERDQTVLGIYQSTITNINTANVSQLELLPGIGPVRAQKIIDNRPYQQLEELVNKKVLGQATYLKLSGLISL